MSTTRIDRTQETIAVDASRLQVMLMTDIIRLAADYVQGNKERKDRILKIAENTKEIDFPFVIENLKRAVSEDVEQAIYLHNPFKRKHDEKIDKAYKEYAREVSFRFSDLSIFCAFQAITETKRVPSYRRAVDKALKIAERLVKELKDETACQAETAYHLTFVLITFTCTNLYDIYHFDEMKKHHELLRDNAEKAMDILDRLKHETDEQKREAYYKQMDEIDQALNDAAEQYYSKVYRYNEAEQIAAAIVSRLYPNADKIKEIAPSLPEDDRLFKITQTAGLSDAIYSLPRITKRGELIDNYITQKQVYTERKHDIDLQFSALLDGLKKSPVITENHIKVFLYVLREHANTGKTRVLIDYKEFFELKGIKDTKDNRKKLRQEVKELENIEFDYRYKEGGKWHKVSNARVFMYTDTRNGKGITVTLGSWVDYLPANKTYMQIDRELFRLPVKNNKIGATTLLYKLRELNHMGKRAVAVSKILDLKEIDDSELKKRGFTYAKDLIEKDFETLEREIGLKWQYRNGLHDSRADFETDYIEFMFED